MTYPEAYTTQEYLYDVRDFAQTNLAADIEELPTSITVESTSGFPATGIITISRPGGTVDSVYQEEWAISFEYTGITDTSFTGLTLVKGTFSPKYSGDSVTLNVISEHHNILAQEVIAIEGAVGTREDEGDSISGRLEILNRVGRTPRAFFTSDVNRGFAPLTVNFTDLSTRGPTRWVWTFGDGEASYKRNASHTFTQPGRYFVRLTVYNDHGSDVVEVPEMIQVLGEPPDKPALEANPRKAIVGETVAIRATPSSDGAEDRFREWTWVLPDSVTLESGDTLSLPSSAPSGYYKTSSSTISVSFTQGGQFDVEVVGTNNNSGSSGIRRANLIESTESTNLWDYRQEEGEIKVREMGLISQTFKTGTVPGIGVSQDVVSSYDRGVFPSSNPFTGIFLSRTPGGILDAREYDGFLELWTQLPNSSQAWNSGFASFTLNDKLYVLFGKTGEFTSRDEVASYDLQSRTGWSVNNVGGSSSIFSTEAEIYTSAVSIGSRSEAYILRRSPFGVFDEMLKYVPSTDTVVLLEGRAPTDRPPTDPNGSGGAALRTASGQLVSLSDGIYLFGPVGGVAKFDVDQEVWQVDSNNLSYFDTTERVSAAGQGTTAFVENLQSRFFSRYNSVTGVFTTLSGASGIAIEKGVY